ncbi:MAG: hypothetical protein JXA68_04235 [Ignavibacteriales bacterium]|nr:hypothetical protein [Ignavibacteriales bacterium]
MITEFKIKKLNELLKSINSDSRISYAQDIINELIENYNHSEATLSFIKSKKIGIRVDDYNYFIEKCIDVLETLGFDRFDLFKIDYKAIKFIKKHKHKLKKPLDREYLLILIDLYRYHTFTFDKEPNNLTDLKNAYTEIENNRD